MTVSQLVLTFASDWLKVCCGFSSLIVKLSEGKTIQSQSSLNFLKIALFWLVLISDWKTTDVPLRTTADAKKAAGCRQETRQRGRGTEIFFYIKL